MREEQFTLLNQIRSKKRIFIWGNGCAGKSTFAQRLSEMLPYERFHVDDYRWQEGWVERDKKLVKSELLACISLSHWIVEDGSIRWAEPLIHQADMVIWLDPPVFGCTLRAIKRSIDRREPNNDDKRGPEPIMASITHWRWIIKYAWKRRSCFKKQAKTSSALIHLRKWKDIKNLMYLFEIEAKKNEFKAS